MRESGQTTKKTLLVAALATFWVHFTTPPALAAEIRLTIETLAPDTGLFLTPMWIGLHDGTFDLFNIGSPASAGLESLAEDGATAGVMSEFTTGAPGGVQPADSFPLSPRYPAS